MPEFPRAQKIAALVAVTAVVVITLITVNFAGPDEDIVTPAEALIDPNATPTAVPILERPRSTWTDVASQIRGAAGTAAPVPCPFVDERVPEANNFLSITPALTFVCDVQGLQATPIAPGRVVMSVQQTALTSEKAEIVANGKDGPWVRAAAYGPFVVIDHGAINGVGNVTSVYAGLDQVNPELRLGQQVDTSTPLGRLGPKRINDQVVGGVLTFEFLTEDTRFGSDPLRANPPPASAGAELATMLADAMQLPITTCSLPFGNPDLNVGAPREYRSGTHNGLDFNCGTIDHRVLSAGDGEVLFIVDDYLDADPDDRNAVLANAALAVDTPFWTLAMLYGRFVVVAHHLPESDDQVVTIYAHLSEIDPNIVIGRTLVAGELIGMVGNTGTSAAANGILDTHSSVHLHWELHVNDRPVGYLSDPLDTEPLYRQMLCDAPPASSVSAEDGATAEAATTAEPSPIC
ncbi:MAG: peptidoglycan DD-metalloendopeptidase family protein [Actinomycetota bacterium]